MLIKQVAARLFGSVSVVALMSVLAWPQQPMSPQERDQAQGMLDGIATEVRAHYYDAKLHGADWDAAVTDAKAKIAKATSLNDALQDIAAALDKLNDSHTFLVPPPRSSSHEYGLRYAMIGDRCFVTQVRPVGDAASKSIKPGDEIMTINDVKPTRAGLWSIQYGYTVLHPQLGLRISLVNPKGDKRDIDLTAKSPQSRADSTDAKGNEIWRPVRELDNYEAMPHPRYAEYGDPLLVLKAPEFSFSQAEVTDMVAKASKHKALVLDLRGNSGGTLDALKFLLGGVFDSEVKIADRVGRGGTTQEMVKPLPETFAGPVIVLVDSRTASAAELFARVIQIEKRGVVIGDQTAGSVMEAKHYDEEIGADSVASYGASITDADLIMSDGKSLEHVGVTPDQVLLTGAKALAAGRDPILSHAAELVGVKLDPTDAGKLFPYQWAPE